MQKIDGFFPLYWEEGTGNLFLEIPELGKEVLWAKGLSAGTVCINTGVRSSVDAPFGGFRESGLGKERGKESMLDDTQLKNVRFGLQ